jgi:ADP-heptose:LPS heptosyltransferase
MPLLPDPLLAKADKILFIAHLAIGDFTYLQNFFKAFAKAYPQLTIDLWIDEVRCTADPEKWESLKNYSLYDWAQECAFFNKVYRKTYSPALRETSIEEAQGENYPLIVSLATLRPQNYALLARKIGPKAFIVGMKNKPRWFAPWDALAYAKLDAYFAPYQSQHSYHITDRYADWFHQLCGLHLTEQERFPFVDMAEQWQRYAQNQLKEWNVGDKKVVFINAYAKTKKRCWPLDNVIKLIHQLRAMPSFKNTLFIVNAIPGEIDKVKRILMTYRLHDTHLFSAQENFFQLPAILQRCHLIISVETAVMHLANAVRVPVIALMRQKNPEWVPIDSKNSTVITTQRRRDWVKTISADQVCAVTSSYLPL